MDVVPAGATKATTTINKARIPVPVAVVLHNLVHLQKQQCDTGGEDESPKEAKKNDDAVSSPTATSTKHETTAKEASSSPQQPSSSTTTTNWRFHPEHTSSLLPLLRLDITVSIAHEDEKKSPKLRREQQPTVVYSQTLSRRSVHPSWEHLDEQIHVSQSKSSCWWNDHDLYKSMRLKLFLVTDERKDDDEERSRDDSAPSLVDFMEVPLYPSLLVRMDMGTGKSATPSDDGSRHDDDDKDDTAGDDRSLPPLPPNALMVHYSDGSVRCLPHVHQLVWEYCHRHNAAKTTTTTTPLVEDFSRFEDDVFKTLDHVHSTPPRRERTASSLLDQEEGNVEEEEEQDGWQEDTALQQQEAQEMTLLEKEMQRKLRLRETSLKENRFPLTKDEALELDLKAQNVSLERQIEEEERLLEQELQSFKEDQAHLACLVKELQEVDDDVVIMQSELQIQSLGLQRDEVLKQALSIKLVRDLQAVYPITLDTPTNNTSSMALSLIGGSSNNRGAAGGYLIRGLRLPVDIYTTTVPEEEINASLGYCAHLVYMIAKYLAIPLRHRIFCNSSRSAIQQDGVGVFPLFLGRMVARSLEREQVDRGARLLGANVNCILMHLNMPSSLRLVHILARLQAILSFVATGDHPSNKLPQAGSSNADGAAR